MFAHSDVFTVILLMNGSLGIPATVGTMIVTPTSAKAARLAHKTKRRERSQPRKPFRRIGSDVQFPLLWADKHITAFRCIFQPVEKCHFSVELTERRAFLRHCHDSADERLQRHQQRPCLFKNRRRSVMMLAVAFAVCGNVHLLKTP